MSDDEQIQRSQIAIAIARLWSADRVDADAAIIDSVSAALVRLSRLKPAATAQLDDGDEDA
ncbi:MAG: hypothetical protein ACRD1H_10290 [Vicinamibacterales bacterium]